jgi:hypothetical protein
MSNQEEEWKIILSNNNYEVSNFGKIRNPKKHILKSYISKGYESIRLNKKTYSVHRLVAQEFILNPNNFPIVNHLDRNKLNNKITNLEWTNYLENNNHAIKTGKNTYKLPIRQYDLNGNFIRKFDSSIEASKFIGISSSHIRNCARGVKKTAGGFIWKYNKKIKENPKENISWKKINGYLGYRIYENGNIYSEKCKRYLKPTIEGGYYRIRLLHNKIRTSYYIHVLVAQYFCNNPDSKPIVNHIDGNKLNNHYTNLEWVTGSENNRHAIKLGLNKTIRRVHQYTKEGEYLRSFNNCTEAAIFLDDKKKRSLISDVCRGKEKSAYGYKWKYGETLYDYLQQNQST